MTAGRCFICGTSLGPQGCLSAECGNHKNISETTAARRAAKEEMRGDLLNINSLIVVNDSDGARKAFAEFFVKHYGDDVIQCPCGRTWRRPGPGICYCGRVV